VSVRSDWTGLVVQLDRPSCPAGRIALPRVPRKPKGALGEAIFAKCFSTAAPPILAALNANNRPPGRGLSSCGFTIKQSTSARSASRSDGMGPAPSATKSLYKFYYKRF
jgi:hypothetical protein